MMKGFLSPEDRVKERYSNMASVYQKLNRTISGRYDLKVELVDENIEAPAWSDGQTVTFNYRKIGDIADVQEIVELTGLNYHELSHIMFTPRRDSYFYEQVMSYIPQHAHLAAANILEDQRIETLMTGLYPAVAPYFRSMFMKWCLADPDQWKTNHPLAHGRHYLPREIREEFANRFALPNLTQAFSDIIDEYRMLSISSSTRYSKNAKRAADLVVEFVKLQLQNDTPFGDPNGHGAHDHEAPENGEQDTEEEQKEAQEWAQWYEESEDDGSEEDGSEEEGTASGHSGDDDTSDSEDSDELEESGDSADSSDDSDDSDDSGDDGDSGCESESGSDGEGGDETSASPSESGDGDGDDGSDDGVGSEQSGSDSGPEDLSASDSKSTDSSDERSEDEDGSGAMDSGETPGSRNQDGGGAGTGKGSPKSVQEFQELLEEALEEVLTDSSILKDAKEKREQFKRGDGTTRASIRTADYVEMPVSPFYKNASSKFAKALARLTADADPGWKTHQSSGKINIQRAMNGADLEDLYDRWDEGVHDATDIECVVLVDGSGSMARITDKSMQAMWAIKRAMDQMKASTTVYEYDTDAALIYSAQEKAMPTEYRHSHEGGGTNPKVALDETMRVFYNSKRTHKIFIIVTDGDWNRMSRQECEDIIERMGNLGVTTALVYLDNGYEIGTMGKTGDSHGDPHKCHVYGEVHDASDLIPFAKNIVTSVMRGRS